MSTLTYLKNFVRDYRVASVTPTSSFGVKWLCERIDFESARSIVEFGPGAGVISKEMIHRMHPEARLTLIELNEGFVRVLRERISDPRVSVHHADAKEVRSVIEQEGLDGIDHLVTGIPFSYLSAQARDHIVKETSSLMRRGGSFLAYQTIWQQDRHLLDYLTRYYDHTVSTIELRNAPPLRLYRARKNGSSNGKLG